MRRLLAALALALVGVAALAPAAAGQDEPSQDATVRLVSQTDWLAPGGTFDVQVAVDDVDPDADLALSVTVHQRLGSRSAYAQTLEGTGLRGTIRSFSKPLAEVPRSLAGDLWVSLPFPSLRQGVYGVTVALRPRSGGAPVDSFVTHLVALAEDPDTIPLSVAWIQPVGTTPQITAEGRRPYGPDELTALRTGIEAVGDAGIPLTLDLTPETVAALGPADVAPLRRAAATGSQLLATPYVDVDPGALVDAGRGGDIAVQRQEGEEVLLAALGDRGDPRTWSAQALSAGAVARLRDLGVTRVVLPEDSLEPLGSADLDGLSLTRPFRLAAGGAGVVQAAAIDTALLEHFRDGDDQVLAAYQLLAELAVLYLDLPGTERGLVLRPPDGWEPDGRFLDVVLGALGEIPAFRPVTVEDLFDDVDPLEVGGEPAVRTTVGTGSGSLPAGRLAEASRALDEVRSMTPAGEGPSEVMRERLLVSESRRLSSQARGALLDAVVTDRDRIRNRLRIPEGRSYRLTAREGTIPLTVANDNPFPVRARLVLSSDKLEFPGDASIELELEPGNNARTVPVRALASGSFTMRATLYAPSGEELLRRDVQINSSAFSGVGIVLSIGAGAFLLLWWGRHWRTVRRDRRLVDVPH